MDLDALRNYAGGIKEELQPIKREIIAKVVGVTFEGRQELLAKMTEFTLIRLERDRRNSHDPMAVKVMADINGYKQVGFIPKAMAKKVANHLDSGNILYAAVKKIVGGNEISTEESIEFLNYGLEIRISPEVL
jgi:hypothetical protein